MATKTRKSLQKLLALLMVLSMTMGMLNITAFAAGDELICGKTEHAHTAECYEQTLICGQEEGAGHTHTDACYILTCGQEESAGHVHSETCYDAEDNLICNLTEGEGSHSHTDACYSLACGQEESAGHTHSDACYDEKLICGLEEHTHTAECYAEDSEDETNTVKFSGTDKNGNPVEYEGLAVPAEPEETDASVYETEEAVAAALESANALLQQADEAYSQWSAIFSQAMSECKFGAEPLKSVSAYYLQASDSKKAWEKWVDALTERQNEFLSQGCICGDHPYACSQDSFDAACPVCSQRPDLCKGPQPAKKGSYWQFYYNEESKRGTLRITGDYTETYVGKGWWPWDTNTNNYINQAGKQLRQAVTDIIVEDNVTMIGS